MPASATPFELPPSSTSGVPPSERLWHLTHSVCPQPQFAALLTWLGVAEGLPVHIRDESFAGDGRRTVVGHSVVFGGTRVAVRIEQAANAAELSLDLDLSACTRSFQQHFPQLPQFPAGLQFHKTRGHASPTESWIDRLVLRDLHLIYLSHPDLAVGLHAGVSWLARCPLPPGLGLLAHWLPDDLEALAQGQLQLPQAGTDAALATLVLPLPLERNEGPLQLHNWQLHLHTPLTDTASPPAPPPGWGLRAELRWRGGAKLTLNCDNPAANRVLMHASADLALPVTAAQLATLAGSPWLQRLPRTLEAPLESRALRLSALNLTFDRRGLETLAFELDGLAGRFVTQDGIPLHSLQLACCVHQPYGATPSVSYLLRGTAEFAGQPCRVELTLPPAAKELATNPSTAPSRFGPAIGRNGPVGLRQEARLLAGAPTAAGVLAAVDPALLQILAGNPLLAHAQLGALHWLRRAPTKGDASALAPQPVRLRLSAQLIPRTAHLPGATNLQVSGLQLRARRDAQDVSAELSGVFVLDGTEHGFHCELPGSTLQGELAELRLGSFLGALCERALPPGLDLPLTQGHYTLQIDPAHWRLSISAQTEGLGKLSFAAWPHPQGWRYTAELALRRGRLAELPGLAALAPLDLATVLSDVRVRGANFVATGDAPGDGPPPPAPAGTAELDDELQIHANWQLDAGPPNQRQLARLLQLRAPLPAQLHLGDATGRSARLCAPIEVGSGALRLVGQLTLTVSGDTTHLDFAGKAHLTLAAQTLQFTSRLQPLGAGQLLSGGTAQVLEYRGLRLEAPQLMLGIDTHGTAALTVVGSVGLRHCDLVATLCFDALRTDAVQLAASLAEISLADLRRSLAPQAPACALDFTLARIALRALDRFVVPTELAQALDCLDHAAVAAAFAARGLVLPADPAGQTLVVAERGRLWFVTDCQRLLHYQLERTQTGVEVSLEPQLQFAPSHALQVHAGLQLLDLDGRLEAQLTPELGLLAEGQLEPVWVGNPQLFELTAPGAGSGGPLLSIASYARHEHSGPEAAPHVRLQARLCLLGASRDCELELRDSGLGFALEGELAPGLAGTLQGCLGGRRELGVGGVLRLHLSCIDLGLLGQARLQDEVIARFDLLVGRERATLSLAVSLRFGGQGFDLARLHCDPLHTRFDALSEYIRHSIAAALLDFLHSPGRWLALLQTGAIIGVAEPCTTLRQQFGLSAAEAARALQQSGFALTDVARWLCQGYGLSAGELARSLRGSGAAMETLASAIQAQWPDDPSQLASALRAAGYSAEQTGMLLHTRLALPPPQLAVALSVAGYSDDQVRPLLRRLDSALAHTIKDLAQRLRSRHWF